MAKTQCVLDIMEENNYIAIIDEHYQKANYKNKIPLKQIGILTKNVPDETAQSIIDNKIKEKIQKDKDYIWNSRDCGFYIKHDIEQYVKQFLESGEERRDVSCKMHPWLREWIANNYDCIELERNAFLINTQVREQRIENEKNKSGDALELLYSIL